MARIRTNNVFGTTTNNPLLVGGTTLSAAGLANLGVVASPDTAVITLDPNRVNGAPEIVFVTAHTASATSATITRGEFGTAAREHALGTTWVHGPVGAASLDADVGDYGGFWQAWTPTLTNLTLGNGTVDAEFTRIGDTVHYLFRFTLGSTSAVATSPGFDLPVPQDASYNGAQSHLGMAILTDTGTDGFIGYVQDAGGDDVTILCMNAAATSLRRASVTATVPHTWASTDVIEVNGTYKAL